MKKLFITLMASFILFNVNAQNEQDARKYAATITKEDLYDYLSILASDAMEGRETGERGQKMAAAFISYHFNQIGLDGPIKSGEANSYYQPVKLYSSAPGPTYIKLKDKQLNNFEEIVYYGKANMSDETTLDIVFAGKGTEADYENIDVEGKAVAVIVDNIQGSHAVKTVADSKGAQALFVISVKTDEEFAGLASQMKSWLSGGRLSVQPPEDSNDESGTFFIAPSVAEKIFNTTFDKLQEEDKLKKIKTSSVTYRVEQKTDEMKTENVLGYIEGSDKKEELIVITAHYDHIGRHGKEINNGADDDGSGTSSIIELAEAFAMAKEDGKGPRRSILFMAVTGEEKGLLGSEYYAAHPIFPLENTIVNLNIDMIGRVDPEHEENPNYIYLVGTDRLSSELHEISEQVNATFTQFDLDYTYNDEDHPERIYYRSDHWNFAKNNIPIIFYFNGTHADYHQPTDTIEKIDFELLTKRAQLVFYTAWTLANRDERIVVDKIKREKGSN